jgi:hypothetical protein
MIEGAVRLSVGLALCSPAGPAFAPQTLTGQVISLSCYFQDKTKIGEAGLLCALATVKYEGNPAGLLTSDGKVYQIAGGLVADNNAKVVPLLGHTVRINGDVSEARGHMMMITADSATLVK